jgi:L-iditol 2-dehydrogenase
MKNRIVQLTEPLKVSLSEQEVPELKDGEALVEVRASGICGSDLHFFRHAGLGSHKRKLPVFLGHECAGKVVAERCNKIKIGDRVAIEPNLPDKSDAWFEKGRHNLARSTFLGADDSLGCMADYVAADESQLLPIPNEMSYEIGSLMEPLSVCLHAINLSGASYKDSATVIGCGAIGLGLVFYLKKIGIKNVFAIDPVEGRRKASIRLGCADAFSPDEKLNYQKSSVVFDACGNDKSLDVSLKVADKGGAVVMVGIPETDFLQINPHLMRIKELNFINVRRSNLTMPEAIRLFSPHDIPLLQNFLTHEFELEDCQKAFELSSEYSDQLIKATFKPLV